MPAWQQALQSAQLPLYDVHWTPVVVLQKGNGQQNGGDAIRVGLPDGRIVSLTGVSPQIRRSLNIDDVVYANVVESKVSEARRNDAKSTRNSAKTRSSPRSRPNPRPAASSRNCGCDRRSKARRWCWKTRPAAFWRWPAASPTR